MTRSPIRTAMLLAVSLIVGLLPLAATAQGVEAELNIEPCENNTCIDVRVIVPTAPTEQKPSTPTGYARDRTAGCLYARKNPQPDEFAEWSGDCDDDGYVTGSGILAFTYPNGAADNNLAYRAGNFREGRLQGDGSYAFHSGTVYRGMFLNGRRNGHGTYYMAKSGKTYVGGFLDGKAHGFGTLTEKDGSSIKGLWHRGEWVREVHEGY